MTYSQHGEDDFLARLFWTPSRPAGFKRSGFYVDVGCNHPKMQNNTYFFYLLGWRGVCIDPHQGFAEQYVKERPEDVFVGCAIAEHDGDVTLHYGEHLTLSSLLPSEQNPHQCTVPGRRLDTLLSSLGVPAEFDILSVDVEGYEIEALRTNDFTAHRPRAIVVEYQTMGTVNLELQRVLLDLGYYTVHMTTGNMIAINSLADDWLQL
jgi:FkbM family methyltransferase